MAITGIENLFKIGDQFINKKLLASKNKISDNKKLQKLFEEFVDKYDDTLKKLSKS